MSVWRRHPFYTLCCDVSWYLYLHVVVVYDKYKSSLFENFGVVCLSWTGVFFVEEFWIPSLNDNLAALYFFIHKICLQLVLNHRKLHLYHCTLVLGCSENFLQYSKPHPRWYSAVCDIYIFSLSEILGVVLELRWGFLPRRKASNFKLSGLVDNLVILHFFMHKICLQFVLNHCNFHLCGRALALGCSEDLLQYRKPLFWRPRWHPVEEVQAIAPEIDKVLEIAVHGGVARTSEPLNFEGVDCLAGMLCGGRFGGGGR